MNANATTDLSPAERARWSRTGALAAVAMLLGYLETFVPIPIPGVKLGLANVAVLLALAQHDRAGAAWIAIIKVLAAGLMYGNPLTLAYSAAGTALSLAVMLPLSLLPTLHVTMLSVIGALAHQTGQLLVAQAVLGTPLVWYSAPALVIAGVVTGALSGSIAARTRTLLAQAPEPTTSLGFGSAAAGSDAAGSDATARLQQGAAPLMPAALGPQPHGTPRGALPSEGSPRDALHASTDPQTGLGSATAAGVTASAAASATPCRQHTLLPLAIYLLFVVVTFASDALPWLVICLLVSMVACRLARVRIQEVIGALRPLAAIALITFGAQWLTLGDPNAALRASALSVLRLVALSASSVALVTWLGRPGLAQALGMLLKPFERLGLRTAGPLLAFQTALVLLPQLMAGVAPAHPQAAGRGLRAYLDALPQLVANACRLATTLE